MNILNMLPNHFYSIQTPNGKEIVRCVGRRFSDSFKKDIVIVEKSNGSYKEFNGGDIKFDLVEKPYCWR